jgi:hypothetical protein
MRQTTAGIAAAVLVALACTACAGMPTPVVTVTATEAAAAPATASATPVATTPPVEVIKAVAPAPVADAVIVVPDGVGKDYQSAQDLWRAAGLHVAPATDALGASRLPLIDSNWVVAQDLSAGSKVPDDSFITATVKKYTD